MRAYPQRMDLGGILQRIEGRAKSLNLSLSSVSEQVGSRDMIRNWRRSLDAGKPISPKHDTLRAIAATLGVDVEWLIEGATETPAPAPTGFSDAAAPFKLSESTPPRDAANPAVTAIFGARAGTAATYLLKTDLPAFSLIKGDVLIVDMSRLPEPGEIAIATVFDDAAGTAATIIRRYMPPYLIPGESLAQAATPERLDKTGAVVRYPIIGSMRGCPV